jgi:hypothetical protein
VPAAAITPLPVLWMIPVTLAVAALVALPPGEVVGRVPAAATFRSELSRTYPADSGTPCYRRKELPLAVLTASPGVGSARARIDITL